MFDQATMRPELEGEIESLHTDLDRLEVAGANFLAAFARARNTSALVVGAAAAADVDHSSLNREAESRIASIAKRVGARLA